MKKYLFIGIAIIVGTNLAALSGVAYNRMGEANAQLTLTERELSLPYNSNFHKENSGISLSLNWRTLTRVNDKYSYYNSRQIKVTKDELLALGFAPHDVNANARARPRELYWALEFDGALHKTEIKNVTEQYQMAIAAYEEQPTDANKREKNKWSKQLERAKTTRSRLFFIEAAADYASLETKFNDQQNTLIVKGVAKYSYNSKHKYYNLMLMHLSVPEIMVPLEHADVFSGLTKLSTQDMKAPRYSVNVNWGSRLEPWVTDTSKIN